jgi:TPP-dependent pyruvate/acetoin dehydrogenase alpha subunit
MSNGIAPGPVTAELFGQATGYSGDKLGSIFRDNAQRRFMGGFEYHLPLAVVLGDSSVYQNKGEIFVCLYGEGAIGSISRSDEYVVSLTCARHLDLQR